MNKRIESIPIEVMKALAAHPWPGNIRELRNFVERSVILTPGNVLKPPLEELSTGRSAAAAALHHRTVPAYTLREIEREHILLALRNADWVIGGAAGAAARLGLKRTTLTAKMQKLGICRPPKSHEFESLLAKVAAPSQSAFR
jgi:formate hydrogenlyase transcriptional activator